MNFKSFIYSLQYRFRLAFLGFYYKSRGNIGDKISANGRPERLVFILAGLLGDSLMSFPAITSARRMWPEAHIAVVGKAHNNELFSASTDYDEFYVCDADPFSIRKSEEIKKLNKWLIDQEFDTSIILLGDQYAGALAKAKIPTRVGVSGTPLQACLTHTYSIRSAREWGTIDRLNAFRSLGFDPTISVPTLTVPSGAHEAAVTKMRQYGLRQDESYILLHPFGSTFDQWWSGNNVIPLAQGIYSEFGIRLLVVGRDYALNGISVTPSFSSSDSRLVINLINRVTLTELIGCIGAAKLVISTDSGPFHIAGALSKPTIGLFRHRRPEHANKYPTANVLFGYDEECENLCEWNKCRATPCKQMSTISVDQIIDAVRGLFVGL